ncbi:MAG: hypothetical protein JNK47_11850 [Mesorhizobium sp.]|nr:hypothetical protein [Mesorhizobium sp.]MBL8577912.1 hypothetical protein [Mesorhizobium sp.]
MGDAGDRMDRAGRYVLGLMDEDERERAERDLEVDPAFREAMVLIAERMHVFDKAKPTASEASTDNHDPWRLIKDRIDAMPQMRPSEASSTQAAVLPDSKPLPNAEARRDPEKSVAFGRRKTDVFKVPVTMPEPEVTRVGLHSVPGRMALKLAIALVVAFALGYVAGRM